MFNWNSHSIRCFVLLLVITFALGACGGGTDAPTATPLPFTPVPTFTATAVVAEQPPAAAPAATDAAPPTVTPISVNITPTTPVAAIVVAPTATPAPAPQLVVTAAEVNLRAGPDTTFPILGAVGNGAAFAVTGKNPAGDWWQICCINGQPGWVFAELATVQNVESIAVVGDLPTPAAAAVAEAPTEAPAAPAVETAVPQPPAEAPAAAAPPFGEGSAGNFDPNAQYQIVHFKVLGLDENNGGIRDSSAQHLIFVTVLDANGNGVDGAVVRNAVGEKLDVTTGNKGPGKTEITMYYEPFKLYVAADPSGPVSSQVSNQMGLVFPHLPDLVGKLGDENYEYGACPTLEIKCEWPIQAIHYSYEITFQKVK